MRNYKLAGVDFAIAGLMSEAKDELRLLGGWSHNSRMPEFYARRFLSERANFSNVTRIAADSSEDEFFIDTSSVWGGYQMNKIPAIESEDKHVFFFT